MLRMLSLCIVSVEQSTHVQPSNRLEGSTLHKLLDSDHWFSLSGKTSALSDDTKEHLTLGKLILEHSNLFPTKFHHNY